MKNRGLYLLISCFFIFHIQAFAQQEKKPGKTVRVHPKILGPMLGYVDHREANVWVYCEDTTLRIYLQYVIGDREDIESPVRTFVTREAGTYPYMHFVLDQVEPGQACTYRIRINANPYKSEWYTFQTPSEWRWRGDPPELSFAFGSCHYANETEYDRPGIPYGDTSTDIFNRIADLHPQLMLWLGDNVYLRESDWNSNAGIRKRYLHTRRGEGLQRLLTECPNLSIWDDHDYGPNDANRSFGNKNLTLKAFQDFWANPSAASAQMPGTMYSFDWYDAHFLMLDDRWYRSPELCDSCNDEMILGPAQEQWLLDNLLTMPADEFKFVCVGTQFLNSAKVKENFANCEAERARILDFIDRHKISNVIFLTGDRHFSEVSMIKTSRNSIPVYDITVSPLSSGVHHPDKNEKNVNRVEGSLYDEDRNFGMIRMQGAAINREVSFTLYDKNGTGVRAFKIQKQ